MLNRLLMSRQITSTRRCFTVLTILIGVVWLIPKARGFASFCFTVHSDITSDALKTLNSSPCATSQVIAANVFQDQHEGSGKIVAVPACNTNLLTYAPNTNYRREHHFDRPVVGISPTGTCGGGSTNSTVFADSHAYLMTERNNVLAYMAAGDKINALSALGRALHALQDFFAHSNYVDLAAGLSGNPGDAAAALSTLQNINATGAPEPPCSLKFTSYDPIANPSDPEKPTDPLNYNHSSFAKDFATKNVESALAVGSGLIPPTKFSLAKSMATDASVQFLNGIPNIAALLNSAQCQSKSHPGQIIESGDPNDKSGPQGVGAGQWLSSSSPIPYAIFYTNEAGASAPAQKVTVTDVLDGSVFDLNTVSLGPIGVPGMVVTPSSVPLASNPFNTTVDLRPSQNLLLKITVSLNSSTGTVVWTLQSLDPNTGQPPTNPLVGFLAPGAEGSVVLNANAKSGLPTGSTLKNQATIVFDVNAPIATQQWSNTLDGTAPTSSVGTLPVTENATTFNVSWSGTDVGAGIQDYTIYVADNGGPFAAWLNSTIQTSAVYSGVAGHTYSFYSTAHDLVGNAEKLKTAAQATTTLMALPSCSANYTSQMLVTQGGFRYNNATKQFAQSVTLMNVGSAAVTGPISLVFDKLSSNASVVGNAGVTTCAAPANSSYINANLGSSGAIASGQSISVNLLFNDPSLAAITYVPRVLGGPQGR